MHLPSGYLDGHVEAVTAAVAAGGLVAVARHAGVRPDERCTPARVAAVTAVVFAGQMLNVPVASGTSGHLIGIAAAVALLGTAGGVLSVATVLAVQSLVFADGGLSALGANVVVMALVPGLVAGAILHHGRAERLAWVAVAGAASVLAAVATFSVLFAVGGATGDATTVTVDMVATHLPIAAVEALLTVALVAVGVRALQRPAVLGGLAVLAVLAAPWASSSPDGLERVAIDRGFASFATANPFTTAAADYQLGAGSPGVVAAGLVGVALAGAVAWAATRLLPTAAHATTAA